MSKQPSGYIKVEKRAGEYHISAMRSVRNGHVVGARGKAPLSDPVAFRAEVKRCIDVARGTIQEQEL